MPQVGSAEVAIVPTFKNFRKTVSTTVDGTADTAAKGLKGALAKAGTQAGRDTGKGFKTAFDAGTKKLGDAQLKSMTQAVAKASREVAGARDKERDAAGRVRVAEKQLAEARKKYGKESSQVAAGEERLESAMRKLKSQQDDLRGSTDKLKGAQKELEDATKDVARAADKSGKELKDSGDKGIGGFKSGVLGGIKSFAGPLAAAFAAVGIGQIVSDAFGAAKDMVLDSINLASDAEQSVGAVEAIFKDASGTIEKFGETSDQAVGLSTNSYRELATLLGAQLKNAGLPLDQVAEKTNQLVSLGADLAAQFGGSTADAVSALSSLLRGERDPIEKYGVTMNEASIKAEALAMGLGSASVDADKVAAAQLRAESAQTKYNKAVEKYGADSTQAKDAQAALIGANGALEKSMAGSTGELTQQEKSAATLSQLMKQTADAQGTFAREGDTLAGQQQRNAAAWENLRTELGEKFLPVASEISKFIGDELLPMLSDMGEEFGPELTAALEGVMPALRDFAQDILPLLPDLIQSTVDALPVLIDMFGFLGQCLGDIAKNNATVAKGFEGLFAVLSGDMTLEEFLQSMQGLPGSLGEVIGGIAVFVEGIINAGNNVVEFFTGMEDAGQKALDFVLSIPGVIADGFGSLGDLLVQSGKDLMGGFIKGIEGAPVGDAVSGVLDFASGFFPHSPAKRGPFSGSGWTAVESGGSALMEQFQRGVSSVRVSPPVGDAVPSSLGAGGASGASGASGVSAGGSGYAQTNHFHGVDAPTAVRLADQQFAGNMRKGRRQG